MSEQLQIDLTAGQLKLIAKSYGLRKGCKILDVGTGRGDWATHLRAQGVKAVGIEDQHSPGFTNSEFLKTGSPAANLPGEVQSYDRVIFRGTSLFSASAFHPELMIALANMGSMLKAHGRFLIPVNDHADDEIAHWTEMLAGFPGDVRVRELKPGFFSTLLGGSQPVTVVDLNIQEQQISRLEWHKLARESVMKHTNSAQEAA